MTDKLRRSARSRHAPRRVRRVVIGVSVALLVLFLLDLAYVAVKVRTTLTVATGHLHSMRDELEAGNLEAARSALQGAAAATDAADSLLRHPAVGVLAAVPFVGREADTLRRVAAAANLVTEAGEPGLEAASILEYRDGTIGPRVYDEGRIDLDVLARAEPLVARVQGSLDEAAGELESSERGILPQVRSAVAQAREEVDDAAAVASGAGTLLRLLPRLTGGDGNRKYLLAFQALGEARATGGVAGLFGVLHASDGKLRLGRIAPYIKLTDQKVSPELFPSWYDRTYGVQGALTEWPQANLSPNFPIAARVMLEMYRQSFGERLDGVIAVDAVSLSMLMQGTGPIDVPGFHEEINADNVVRVLSEDAYVAFPAKKEQNAFLGELVRAFWGRIEKGDIEVQPFARGLGRAVATQHLKVFSANRQDRADLEEFDADGSIERFGSNFQSVFHNNYGVNKVDYYLHRRLYTLIEIGAGGDLRVTTRLTLHNNAPDGPRSDLLGRRKTGLPPGTNRLTLNFLLPVGARAGRINVDGKATSSIVYRDSKHPLIWDVITIPPGEEVLAKLVYVVPEGASLGPDGGSLSFSFAPQPLVNVEHFSFTVVTPPGYAVSGAETTHAGNYDLRGDFDVPVDLSVEYRRL